MGKVSADEKILSYNDVVLRRSDLEILSGPYFLNDRIVEFYFSYLTTCHPSEDILLIPPSIAFWIAQCPDTGSLKDVIEPLNLSRRKLVIFPVNDNDNVTQAEGGSHWSLLAFERHSYTFVHHDSLGGYNKNAARQLYRAVIQYIGKPTDASKASYVECRITPRQRNGYDCGLYVTATARAIVRWYESGGPTNEDGLWVSVVKDQVTAAAVSEMQNEILELIKSLMAVEDSGSEP